MSRFSQKTRGARTTNLAGGKAFSHKPEMELTLAVLTTFLKDGFYESADERIERISRLVAVCSPSFVAKLAVVARTKFNLRSVSHVLIGELSRHHRGDDLVARTIKKISVRPDDLVEIAAYLGKPLPNQVKKGIASALREFDAYKLAKYRMEGKEVSLVDVFNLVHPKPKDAKQAKLWKDLMEGKLKNKKTWESRLSSGEDKGKVWKEMVLEGTIGYMALLRNLRNIEEQADPEVLTKACEMIADPELVRGSRQLPFRFYTAYEQLNNHEVLNAISAALDVACENTPEFSGKTLIAIDTSGSMSGQPLTIASIFAAALMKKNDAEVILYDMDIKEMKYIQGTPVLVMANQIQRDALGGGTETSLVFSHAHKTGVKYDRIVILSDNQSWAEGYYSDGVQEAYNRYKRTNNCPVYAIDIAGYGTKDLSNGKVFHLTGWSDKMFEFMKWVDKENQLIEFVENTEL